VWTVSCSRPFRDAEDRGPIERAASSAAFDHVRRGCAVSVRLVRGAYREALASVTRNRNLRLAQLSSLSAWTGEFLLLTAMPADHRKAST
jgi:hypothetical protein